MTYNKKLNIKDWAEEDRPREKLLSKGIDVLSDAELIAILIGSGNRDETAVELAQRILHSVANNLNLLGKLSIKEYCKFKGIGEAKAVSIAAALELGKRRNLEEVMEDPQVHSSKDTYAIMQIVFQDLHHEEVWVILLNKTNRVLKKYQVGKGHLSSAVVDIRSIMREAIACNASAIILCHNHPSGATSPSKEDDRMTLKLQEAGRIMDIQLLDHIIIANKKYYSYRDEERMKF